MRPSSKPAKPLRIVHVAPSYAPLVGGAERMVQEVSERLVERGHDVTVLTFDCATIRDFRSGPGAGLPRREAMNGVQVIRVGPAMPRVVDWCLRLPGGWRTSVALFGEDQWPLKRPSGPAILAPLARLRADVVTSVNWGFALSFWACPPRAMRRAPRVAIPVLHIEREWANNPLYPRMLKRCDGVIVLTEAEGEFVRARGGTEVSVAAAGVDPERFRERDGAAIRARYDIRDRPVVGFVGRQVTLKGVPTLIDAMKSVWRCVPDAMLLLAGQSAHREPGVNEMLAALSEADRARVVLVDDFADADLPSIMDACDVLALPSAEESFGLVMLEAWVCGKPVIGADIASTRCIIESGVDGLMAPPYDAPALAERIVELLRDPAKRKAFGEAGRAKVLARYTWDRVTDVWEAALAKAAASRRSIARSF